MTQRTRLVGRRDELALLRAHLSGAGDARMVIVTGEAGIGKTSLVTEACASFDGVLLGARCLPWSSPMSLQPITDLVRAAYEIDATWVGTALAACPPYVGGAIAGLVPELGEVGDPGAPVTPDEYARPRLMAAIRAFWIAVADTRRCALVVDDGHWADAMTVDLLDHLMAQPGGTLPPLLLTYRTGTPGTESGTVGRLHGLAGAPGVARVQLFGLSRGETATLIADLTGAESSVETLNAIFARSEGHPLFAAQLATAPPGHLPRALVDLFASALAVLDDDATRVTWALAVAMRPMEQSMLCDVTGLSAYDVETAVRQLDRYSLLRPSLDGRVDLRHALLMELVRSRLPDLRRAEISGRLAHALAAPGTGHPSAASAAELATLFGDAGNAEEELHWRVRAAQEGTGRHTWTAAAEHWRRVVELLPTSLSEAAALESLTGLSAARIYGEASEALEVTGDVEGAAELACQALEHVDADDVWGKAEALRRAGPLVAYRVPDRGRPMLDEAIELYEQLPPSPGLALAYRRRAFRYKGLGRHDEAATDIDRGLKVADELGSTPLRRRLLADRAWSDMEAGDVTRALRRMATAWDLDRSGQDFEADIYLTICHTDILLKAVATATEVQAAAAPGLRALDELALDESFRVSLVRSNVVEALLAEGDLQQAQTLLDGAHAGEPTSANWATFLARAEAAILAGELETAGALIEQVSGLAMLGIGYRGETAKLEALLLLWTGHPEAALDRLHELLASVAETREVRFSGSLFAMAARAARESARDPAPLRRLRTAAAVDPFAGPVPADAVAHGAVWEAELAELEDAPDAELWSRAADLWRPLPRPHQLAYCLLRYAETILTTSRARVSASESLAEAHALARQHQPLRGAVERVAGLAGIRLAADDQQGDDQQGDDHRAEPPPYDLTPRELDVLRLLSAGLSNAQIGRRLFISPKTTSVHVTHILSKLHARTRAHAATIAVGEGVVPTPSGPTTAPSAGPSKATPAGS